jgi:CheY-specific phosphatase CheX
MWNEIKNFFKRMFGLVDTNHDGKVSVQEAQAAAFNAKNIEQTAKADFTATTNKLKAEVEATVTEVKQDVNIVTASAKETIKKAKLAVDVAKTGNIQGATAAVNEAIDSAKKTVAEAEALPTKVRRGRKPKAG